MFIARKTDFTVGVQTAAREPFVSFFSGDSGGGKERRNGGFLDAMSIETHKDVLVNRQEHLVPTVGHVLKHLSQPQEREKNRQDSPRFVKDSSRHIQE